VRAGITQSNNKNYDRSAIVTGNRIDTIRT
jgi:hypothetical protein